MKAVKFNFIIDCKDSEIEYHSKIDVHRSPTVFTRGDLNWCLQAYLNLSRKTNLQTQLSNHLQHDWVNIIHSHSLLEQKGDPSHFIACVRADYPSRNWAHYHLVQNKNQVSANASYIPHWVQPGLIGRNPARTGLKTVAYAGQLFNGNLAGSVGSWQKLFSKHNINFITLTESQWHDLSEIDALIAIRSFDDYAHNTKPPTKLLNAWQAGIPLVGGYDSAFAQEGVAGEHYLIAKNQQEAVEAVLKLRDQPELYQKLVTNGYRKSATYSEDAITQIWKEILTGPLMERYTAWKAHQVFERIRFKSMLQLALLKNRPKQILRKVKYHFNL